MRRRLKSTGFPRIPLISGAGSSRSTSPPLPCTSSCPTRSTTNPDQFKVDPDTARLFANAAYSLSPEAAFPLAAPLVLAASLVFLRTQLTPSWFDWAGFVVAAGCLLGFLGVTTGLFLLWVVVVQLARHAPGPYSTPS